MADEDQSQKPAFLTGVEVAKWLRVAPVTVRGLARGSDSRRHSYRRPLVIFRRRARALGKNDAAENERMMSNRGGHFCRGPLRNRVELFLAVHRAFADLQVLPQGSREVLALAEYAL